jgi:hypothetical protein
LIHKIIISVIAAAEVLTLFPMIFFGIAMTVDSIEMVKKDSLPIMVVMMTGIFYMTAVLLGGYKAIQNFQRPVKAYLYLSLPLIMIAGVFVYKTQF